MESILFIAFDLAIIVAAFALAAAATIIWFVIWLCRTARTPSNSPEAPPVYPHPQVQDGQWQHRQQQGHDWHKFQYSEPALNSRARWQELNRTPQTELREMTQFGVVNEFQQRTRDLAPPDVRGDPMYNGRHRMPSAKSDYPPYFRSLERDTLLPENAKKHHIFTGNPTPDSIMRGAPSMSNKRSLHISKNTVFCAPEKWHAWKTQHGPRIVSSERVVTVQCERRGSQGLFFGEMVGMKYAIFRNDGHLLFRESLQS